LANKKRFHFPQKEDKSSVEEEALKTIVEGGRDTGSGAAQRRKTP
jgi:hypothetical protein